MADPMTDACRNCRRPLYWVEGVGWLHGELPQYAHEPIRCNHPKPVCRVRACDHVDSGPDPDCDCVCHGGPGVRVKPKDQFGGEETYVGGPRDGEVTRCIPPARCLPNRGWPTPKGGIKRHGARHWYVLDADASTDTRAVYRYAGHHTDEKAPR